MRSAADDPLTIVRHESDLEVRLQLRGRVDVDAAEALRQAATPVNERAVILDFRSAFIASDAALAFLVAAISAPNVACVGLGQHHERILKYLGVAPACVAVEPKSS